MQILSKPASGGTAPTFSTADLVNTIEGQLTAIRGGDLSKAYYAYTSRDFQRATPAQSFEKFVAAHPGLKNNQVANFSNLSFKNDVGTFQGSLTSADQEIVNVEYDLVYEDGKWRILSVQLLPGDGTATAKAPTARKASEVAANDEAPSRAAPRRQERADSGRMDITRLVIGTDVDRDGRVKLPRTRFSGDVADLHADLFVNEAPAGAKAELILEHVESRTRVPPVDTLIEASGDAVLSFIFTSPTHGWPKGTYRLIARTSNGKEKIQEFKVD
jgi:hypothetical protein